MERRYMIEIYNKYMERKEAPKKQPAKFSNKKEFKDVMKQRIASGEVVKYKLTEKDKEIMRKAGM